MDIQRKVARIKEAEEEICRAFMQEENMKSISVTERISRLCWKASFNHQFTINVDGSVKYFTKRAGFGGILRDVNGEWLEGFSCKTELGDAAVIEAKAIVGSMKWAWEKGIRDVEIQSDTSTVIKWIQDKTTLRGPIRELIEEANRWIDRNWRISIKGIFREQNQVADLLSTLGAQQQAEWATFTTSPPECEKVYLLDLAHATRVRRVRESN